MASIYQKLAERNAREEDGKVGGGEGGGGGGGGGCDLQQLLKRRVGELGKGVYEGKVAGKVLLIEAPVESLMKRGRKQHERRRKRLQEEQRPRRLGDVKLWRSQAAEGGGGLEATRRWWKEETLARLVEGKGRGKKMLCYQDAARMDWMGAELMVAEASDPSQVGVEGTVIEERRNSLALACADGRVRLLGKKDKRLHARVGGMVVRIDGSESMR
eukprot:756537-Hanusia_phi.AAC.6